MDNETMNPIRRKWLEREQRQGLIDTPGWEREHGGRMLYWDDGMMYESDDPSIGCTMLAEIHDNSPVSVPMGLRTSWTLFVKGERVGTGKSPSELMNIAEKRLAIQKSEGGGGQGSGKDKKSHGGPKERN